jgi:hypothetical protein
MTLASDTATSQTIAGHAFTVEQRPAGVLHLRISLHGGSMAELALRLTAIQGVRVTRGPDGLTRCYVAHCAGFTIVLSAEDGADSALALVSPTPKNVEPVPGSELSTLLAGLLANPAPRPTDTSPWRRRFVFGKQSVVSRSVEAKGSPHLPRTPLAPGKPLSRKAPLMRKTPLGRGKQKPRS